MRVLKPRFEHIDERGSLREVVAGNYSQMNAYERKKDSIAGNHYHKLMEEFFYITHGKVKVSLLNISTGKKLEFTVEKGDAFKVYPYEVHTLRFLEDTGFITLLSKTFDTDNPDIYAHKIDI